MAKRTAVLGSLVVLVAAVLGGAFVWADSTPQTLPFSQGWANASLITTSDDWSGVAGIEGFRGDSLTASNDVDPQTVVAADDPGVLDVNANQTNPNTFATGGVAEFAITDPVVALQGSGTADAPYLRFYLNTTGQSGITVKYNLRDIDGSTDNAAQQVALQYRIGSSGNFTNVPAAYIADATTGPSLATLVTSVCAVLPAAANNQSLVQVRVITTNAAGNDEWVGIDDIQVNAGGCGLSLSINDVAVTEGDAGTATASFTVSLTSPAPVGGVTFDIATQDNSATTADSDYVSKSLTGQSIAAGNSTYTFDVTVNGDTAIEGNETFFVNVTNVAGTIVADGQGIGTITNDDVVLTPIHDIQGSGSTSPLSGTVSTRGIVTARKYNNGFFIQEPDANTDANPATSEGIFVYTGSAPPAAAAVGNLVQVTGTVSEFVPSSDPGQPPLTELTSPSVSMVSTGNALPAPIPLTATFPDPTGSYDQLERIEGMRVSVGSFMTTSGTLAGPINETTLAVSSYGEFFGVITGVARPFREAGIEAPNTIPSGTIPPIPRWDANPELLRVDSDGQIGVSLVNLTTGSQITNMVGVLDYAYRRYSILPDAAVVPTGGMSATAVQTAGVDDVTVGSFNLRRFFNNVADTEVAPQPTVTEPVPDASAWATRLDKVSLAIRDYLRSPDIIGVEEVENEATLDAIAAKVSADAITNSQPDPLYDGYVMPGNDIGGINIGFLVKKAVVVGSTPRVAVNAVVQEGQATTWIDPSDNVSHLLNDRPPLRLDATVAFADGRTFPLQVIVVHQRSLSGVDDDATPDGLTTTGNRVRQKRNAQAVWLANLIQARQAADPDERLVVLGDFNTFEVNDGLVDVMGTLLGAPSPNNQTVVPGDGADLVNPNFTRLGESTPAERYSWVQDGNAQNLDHVIVNEGLLAHAMPWMQHARIDADFSGVSASVAGTAVRTSDHDPMVAFLTSDVDGDGIADSLDPCDDSIKPAFTETFRDQFTIEGTVADCSGVASIALKPGSSNFTLEVFGNPGDTTRSWRVRRIVDNLPCDGELIAYDSVGTPEPGEFYVGLDRVMPVPALGSVGLALLGLIVALLGAAALGRRSTLV